MKLIIMLLTSLLVSQSIFATNYICTDTDGHHAELTTLTNGQLRWSEPWHSAMSKGVYKGKVTAPYSPYKGYDLYKLEDFYLTNDSAYMLALSKNQKQFIEKAVVYFDNDDHAEEETIYNCYLTN